MYLLKIRNHQQLQNVTSQLTEMYQHPEPMVLRGAILEVLQNTVQHADGAFALFLRENSITIVNIITNGKSKNNSISSSIGLKLYQGIKTRNLGQLFIAEIIPQDVSLNKLDLYKDIICKIGIA